MLSVTVVTGFAVDLGLNEGQGRCNARDLDWFWLADRRIALLNVRT